MTPQSRMSSLTGYLIVAACAFAGLLLTWWALGAATVGNQRPAVLDLHAAGQTLVVTVTPADSMRFSPGASLQDLSHLAFHQTPSFLVWTMLMACMVAVAAGAFPLLCAQIRALKHSEGIPVRVVILSAMLAFLIIGVIGVLTGGTRGVLTLDYVIRKTGALINPNSHVVQGIVYATMTLTLPAIMLILLVAWSSGRVGRPEDEKKLPLPPVDPTSIAVQEESPDSARIAKAMLSLANLHRVLTSSLQVLAIIVVFSVLTSTMLTASLRPMIEVRNSTLLNFELFPPSHAYMYGLGFSIFLAILYFPAHLLLKERWRSLSIERWKRRTGEGRETEPAGLENLESSPLDHLKIAFSILAPLITSILPEHISLAG